MRIVIRRLIAVALTLGFSASAWPRDLTGQWNLNIEDKNHHVVTGLVIEFTAHQAPSCIGGNWLRVNVVSATTEDAHFFPVSEPLSYSIEKNQLTIGRNEICDAYLALRGALNDETIRGEYFSFGWGSKPLGFFALSKKK
jgi:hypothetical protein